MGNKGGKGQCDPKPDSNLMTFMKDKYGNGCCDYLPYWYTKGFPETGSLSKNQLLKLRQELQKDKDKLYEKKKVKSETAKKVEDMDKCLKMWEEESDKRERQQCQKALTMLKVGENDKPKKTQNSPKPSALYPSLQNSSWSKVDFQDSSPPPYQPQVAAAAPSNEGVQHQQLAPAPRPAPPPPPQSVPSAPATPAHHDSGASDDSMAFASGPGSSASSMTFTPASGHSNTNPFVTNTNPEGFSPIGTRLRSKATVQMPMVQVAGQEGPMYVFGAWNSDDIIKAAKHLPKPDKGGEKLAKDFMVFISQFTPTAFEMARVMNQIFTPGQLNLLKDQFAEDRAPSSPDWATSEVQANRDYRYWVRDLLGALRQHFPVVCDLSKVSSCTQRDDEEITEYAIRLQTAFDDHSGMPRPDPYPGALAGPYECMLKQHFFQGLNKELAALTRDSCVGADDPQTRLADVIRHAKHCQQRQREKAEAEKKKRTDTKYRMNLNLLQQTTAPQAPPPQGAQRYSHSRDECFYCHQQGHWSCDCPKKRYQRRGRGRDRGGFRGGCKLAAITTNFQAGEDQILTTPQPPIEGNREGKETGRCGLMTATQLQRTKQIRTHTHKHKAHLYTHPSHHPLKEAYKICHY